MYLVRPFDIILAMTKVNIVQTLLVCCTYIIKVMAILPVVFINNAV